MQRKLFTLIAFGLLLVSCTHKVTVVSPASETQTLSPQGMIYVLPSTSFRVRIESTHKQIIPGPFSQYAEKYLGISGVNVSPLSEWQITGVEVAPILEPDQSTVFAIEPADDFRPDFLQLTSKGLVIPINSIHFQGSDQVGLSPKPQVPQNTFTDLSPTPFIAAERTTHYSRVFQDSAFVRVPIHKTVVVEKSIEDKAREAADFIFALRKKRFELLSGDADFVAEGKAAESVLNEINRLEIEYLYLFIGVTFENQSVHWFDFKPDPNSNGATILFRFSPSKGVLPLSDLSGSPVLIAATKDQDWNNISLFNQLTTEKESPRTDAIYYRIPVPVSIKLSYGNVDLFSRRMEVFQFGPLVRMPANFIIKQQNR